VKCVKNRRRRTPLRMSTNPLVSIRRAELADAVAIAGIYHEAIIYVGTLKQVGHKSGG